jgi:hypothetical protein
MFDSKRTGKVIFARCKVGVQGRVHAYISIGQMTLVAGLSTSMNRGDLTESTLVAQGTCNVVMQHVLYVSEGCFGISKRASAF